MTWSGVATRAFGLSGAGCCSRLAFMLLTESLGSVFVIVQTLRSLPITFCPETCVIMTMWPREPGADPPLPIFCWTVVDTGPAADVLCLATFAVPVGSLFRWHCALGGPGGCVATVTAFNGGRVSAVVGDWGPSCMYPACDVTVNGWARDRGILFCVRTTDATTLVISRRSFDPSYSLAGFGPSEHLFAFCFLVLRPVRSGIIVLFIACGQQNSS